MPKRCRLIDSVVLTPEHENRQQDADSELFGFN